MWARSYALRAVLAVGLFLLFYFLALGSAAALLALPYTLFQRNHRVSSELTLACVVAAIAILWGVTPRPRRFRRPGIQVTEADQPRLFERVRGIAREMNAAMPAEVYLIADVNAFVLQRGGVLGIGGRRVLGVGLSLLNVDSLSQLDATLAHEFGHFLGGETRLNAIIYQTRSAMIRTQETFRASGTALLHKPFGGMLNLYLRLTQAVSRQQELLSDEWSVRVAGREAHVSGLRTEGIHSAAFRLYMRQEVEPLTRDGVSPENLFEGFRRYTQSPRWMERMRGLGDALESRQSAPYDSHPSLEERIAFAHRLAVPRMAEDTTPARSLLEAPEQLERQLSAWLRPVGLRPVSWTEVVAHWSARWCRTAARLQEQLPALTVGTLAELLRDSAQAETLAVQLYPELGQARAAERRRHAPGLLHHAVSAYLGSVLAANGFEWRTAPGDPIELVRGAQVVDPMLCVEQLRKGSVSLDALLATYGIPASARSQGS